MVVVVGVIVTEEVLYVGHIQALTASPVVV